MKKIGITTHSYTSSLAFPSNGISMDYQKKLFPLGMVPYLLPFLDQLERMDDLADDYASQLDGLILSGGDDICPLTYHQPIKTTCGDFNYHRDLWELALIGAFHQRQKPILGICRGMQLLNVYFGGSLHQDLSQKDYNLHWHNTKYPFQETHKVTTKGTILSRQLCKDCGVNSFHHQGIEELGPLFSNSLEVGRSEDDLVELVFDPVNKVLGTQWHPEMLRDSLLFHFFKNLLVNRYEEYVI